MTSRVCCVSKIIFMTLWVDYTALIVEFKKVWDKRTQRREANNWTVGENWRSNGLLKGKAYVWNLCFELNVCLSREMDRERKKTCSQPTCAGSQSARFFSPSLPLLPPASSFPLSLIHPSHVLLLLWNKQVRSSTRAGTTRMSGKRESKEDYCKETTREGGRWGFKWLKDKAEPVHSSSLTHTAKGRWADVLASQVSQSRAGSSPLC